MTPGESGILRIQPHVSNRRCRSHDGLLRPNGPVQARRACEDSSPARARPPPTPATGGSADWRHRVAHLSSGGNLHRRVEVDLSRRLARHYGALTRSRRSNPISPHPAKMKLNRRLDTPEHRIDRLTGSNAPRKIRNRGPPVAVRVLVDAHEVPQLSHDLSPLSPACRLTEPNVPLGISSPKWPLTVTRPDLVGCLN